MRAALQGVPVANLPVPQVASPLGNLAQIASQIAAPTPPPPPPLPPQQAATSGGRAVAPTPTRAAVRPEAAAGLDGWLMDRLFGGSR
jgi:penicillin-binding protein 1A